MPAFGFNKHKRFAVRREVRLYAGRTSEPEALMIELSCEGCRISGVGEAPFPSGREVEVEIGQQRLAGRVHCRNGACLVIKFASVLRLGELEDLVCPAPERDRAFASA